MNYYNEFDPKAASWLRALIAEKLIPEGKVDDRSIAVVTPADLAGFTQCHFFAGIGGWSLALALAGWSPDRPCWSMSCPCQPFSVAGAGKGNADKRHLWPVAFNLIRQCGPLVVFGEQVESAVGHGWLDGISADLEGEGYACGTVVLGAHSLGAPHIRQRLYWMADAGYRERGRPGEQRPDREISPIRIKKTNDATGCGPLRRMVQPVSEGLERYAWDGDDWHKSGRDREATTGPTAAAGNAGGMVFTDGNGCGEGSASASPAGHGDSAHAASVGVGGMGDATGDDEFRNGITGQGDGRTFPAGGSNPWAESTAILCRDGKTRRIPAEPSFFPLADGVSAARVAALRGAGNAIVPAVAAEFIKSYLECQ